MQLNSSQTIAGNTFWHTGNLNLSDDGQNLYYQKKYKIFQTSAKPDVDKGEVQNAATVNRPTINREVNVLGDSNFYPRVKFTLGSGSATIGYQNSEFTFNSEGNQIKLPKVSGTVITTGNYPQWEDVGGQYYVIKNGDKEVRPNDKHFTTAQSVHNILPYVNNSQKVGENNRRFNEGNFVTLNSTKVNSNQYSSEYNDGVAVQFTNNSGFTHTNISGANKDKASDIVIGYEGLNQKTRNIILNKPLLSKTGRTIIDQDGKLDFNDLKNNNKVDKSGDTLTGNVTFNGQNSTAVIFKTDNQRSGSIKQETTLAGKNNSNEILFKNEGIDLKVNNKNILSLDKDKITAQNASIDTLEAQNVSVNGNLLVNKEIPQNDNQAQAANTKWVRTVAIQEIENLKNTISNNGVTTTQVTVQDSYKIKTGNKESIFSFNNNNLKIQNNQNGNLFYKDRLVYDQNTIPIQSTTLKGIVKLVDSVQSTSVQDAATANSVKTVYDKAVSAENLANTKIAKNGDRMTGDLTVPNLKVEQSFKLQNQFNATLEAEIKFEDTKLKIFNPKQDKSLSLENTGELFYNNKKVFTEDQLPQWQNITNKPTTVEGYGIQNAVKQGGKHGQLNNSVYIGWTGSGLKATVDNTDLGEFVFKNHLNYLDQRKLNVTGGTVSQIDFKDFNNIDYSGFKFFNATGRYVRIEGLPHTSANMVQFVYREANNNNINVATLRKRTGELAFKDEIQWSNLTGKPNTISGYGISDAVTTNTAQTITGVKTFNGTINATQINIIDNANAGVNRISIGDNAYLCDIDENMTIGLRSTNDPNKGYLRLGKIRLGGSGNDNLDIEAHAYVFKSVNANHFHSRNGAYFVGNLDCNDVNIRSDIKLKRNLSKIKNSLDKINQLNGYTYDVNQPNTDIWESSAGLIAQDLEKVLPSSVKLSKTGYLTVSYNQVIGLLVESIKELDKRTKSKQLFERITNLFK